MCAWLYVSVYVCLCAYVSSCELYRMSVRMWSYVFGTSSVDTGRYVSILAGICQIYAYCVSVYHKRTYWAFHM